MTQHDSHASTRCRHRLLPDNCPLCGPTRAAVWYTDGGKVFHANRDCEALDAGQDKVAARGGLVSPKRRVSPLAEIADEHYSTALGREACERCVWGNG